MIEKMRTIAEQDYMIHTLSWLVIKEALESGADEIERLTAENKRKDEALERVLYECDNDLSGSAKEFIKEVLRPATPELFPGTNDALESLCDVSDSTQPGKADD